MYHLKKAIAIATLIAATSPAAADPQVYGLWSLHKTDAGGVAYITFTEAWSDDPDEEYEVKQPAAVPLGFSLTIYLPYVVWDANAAAERIRRVTGNAERMRCTYSPDAQRFAGAYRASYCKIAGQSLEFILSIHPAEAR